ncbi:MAG: coenzyme F420-0:L-glutamate ligase [Candidatus Levybacteria bacterium]|nr:coenzyme F420-0:L-glutamate ligase [Candidatus Levybacteria bacterium]
MIKKEAYLYIPSSRNKYHIVLSIKNKSLVSSAGVDESNGGGYFVLWPKNPQKSANSIREMLSKKYKVKNLGVMITDSKSIPLRRGAVGTAIAHSGFSAVKNYIGKKDVFGRKFKVQKSNVLENLAGASVAVMGEGSEQTPIAIISDIGFVKFKKGNPSQKELSENYVKFEDDLFYELFNNKLWVKGKGL